MTLSISAIIYTLAEKNEELAMADGKAVSKSSLFKSFSDGSEKLFLENYQDSEGNLQKSIVYNDDGNPSVENKYSNSSIAKQKRFSYKKLQISYI